MGERTAKEWRRKLSVILRITDTDKLRKKAKAVFVGGPGAPEVAEREGFEPSEPGLPAHVISSHADSTTLASLLIELGGVAPHPPDPPLTAAG